MANPLRDFFFGTVRPKADLVEAVAPHKTFQDVILPPTTRRALDQALIQIQKHDLMFHTWGLAERHGSGLGLAFNFAGPPGTGKTICAEAIAHALGKKLLVVRYSEMESLWAGETGKNVSAVFRSASEQDAVLFFDEADAIAGRRFSSVTQGYQREANTVVNVLLKELEDFGGVVIFATNMAANFDPAFERRIRTHVLFEMPDAAARAEIWRVQLSTRTPLAEDVDFMALAEEFAVSGGDIKNAVLKAAQLALVEPGPDAEKKIHQRHFVQGMRDVMAARRVMEQTLWDPSAAGDGSHALASMTGLHGLTGLQGAWSELSRSHEEVQGDVMELGQRLGEVEQRALALPGLVEHFDTATRTALAEVRGELASRTDALASRAEAISADITALRNEREALARWQNEMTPRVEALENLRVEEKLAAERQSWQSALEKLETDFDSRVRTLQISVIAATCVLAGLVLYAMIR